MMAINASLKHDFPELDSDINNKQAIMDKKVNVIRQTNDEARKLARQLVRTARFGSLAVNSSHTGFPSVSRTLVGTDIDGSPIILVSELSLHTKAIIADNRVSILLGEPGKGDPVAHPRISIQCEADLIQRDNPVFQNLRARFIKRHPKAELYVDFADFRFYRLEPISADLNGGFGKAFSLQPSDFLITSPTTSAAKDQLAAMELGFIAKQNQNKPDALNKFVSTLTNRPEMNWRLIGVDCEGFEVAKGDKILRTNFDIAIENQSQFETAFSEILRQNKI